jgi:branched-chain amino acid transport system substrate-binding protein
MARNSIRIGVIATLVGPLAPMGEEAVRGAQLAVSEFGEHVANKRVDLFIEGSSAIPDSAIEAASKLFERERVDFIIGPLSGNEGLAIRDFANTRPDKAFINGVSAAQDATLRNPAPNFFSFSTNGVQWIAGLGRYAYEELGCRRVATLAEDYSYPHGQVGGFIVEFCRAGGQIAEKFWVALGKKDFSAIIADMPPDIDALFVALAGTDALHFLEHYTQVAQPPPMIGGTNTLDQYVLNTTGVLAEQLVGMVSAGPTADDNPDPAWQRFVRAYRMQFPQGLQVPSHITHGYYVNMTAALRALSQVDGDLSDGQARFQNALANLAFDTPTGPVRLDHNRNAVATIFVAQVTLRDDGSLYKRLVKVIPEVNQTLGIPEDEYLSIGPFNRDNPNCA